MRTTSGLSSSSNFSNAAESMRNSLAKAAKVAETAAQKAAEKGGRAYQAGQQMMPTAPSWPANSRRERSGSMPWLSDDGPISSRAVPELEIRVCSWNLHASQISSADDAQLWLSPGPGADLYIIGVQELVELGARSVVLGAAGDEQKQRALESRVESVLSCAGVEFVKVCSFGMVGQAMLIYARQHLVPLISGMDCDRVKTGLEGLGGNKGCVCARFMLGDLSLCFVNVHLASGQNKTSDRDQHIGQILSDAFQSSSSSGSSRAPKQEFKRRSQHTISGHNLSVIFGDFNSRLDMAKEETWPPGGPDAWLQLDQILLGQAPSLKGYREGLIGFPPTYKYKEGTDDFNRKRAPAWCDRIVFKTESTAMDVELVEYDSQPLKHTSDHRPIAAQFHITPHNAQKMLSAPPTTSVPNSKSTTRTAQTSSTSVPPKAASVYQPPSSSVKGQNVSTEREQLYEAPPVIVLPDASSPVTVAPTIIVLPPSTSSDHAVASTTVSQSIDTPWPDSSPWPELGSECPPTAADPWSTWGTSGADSNTCQVRPPATSSVGGVTPWDVCDNASAQSQVIDNAWPPVPSQSTWPP